MYTTKENAVWKLGTLCVIDNKPRSMNEDEVYLLETLARLVVTELELRMMFKQKEAKIEQKADQHAKTKAKELNSAYIGQVAHDLRTPLNSFALGLQALQGMNLDTEMRSVVDMMSISAELMEMTCTKAIDHSKFEAGQDFAAMKAPFDLVAILRKSQIILAGYTHDSGHVTYQYTVTKGVYCMPTTTFSAFSLKIYIQAAWIKGNHTTLEFTYARTTNPIPNSVSRDC